MVVTRQPRRARRVHGEPAPAGADLEQVVRRPEVELLADEVELGHRRLLERHARLVEQRARVHHRGVEHPLEQVVAEVVVRGDVAAAARRRVAHERRARTEVGLAHGGQAAAGGVQPHDVARGDAEHRRRVRRLPQALRVRLRHPAAAAQQQRPQRRGAHLDDAGRRARPEHVTAPVLDQRQLPVADALEEPEDDAARDRPPHRTGSGRRCTGTPLSLSSRAWA